MPEWITSRENPQIKLAVSLMSRKKDRDETGCFVAEGLRLCLDAVQSGVVVRSLFVTERAAQRWPDVEKLSRAANRVFYIHEAIAEKIADTQAPQGVFAICEKLDIRQCAAKIKRGGRFLLLADIQDPGNLGAMLRTADAFGVDGVFLGGGCADPYGPKVLRGAMGGLFRLLVSSGCDLLDCISRLREAEIPVLAAALTADALTAGEIDFSGGGAVLIGNEGNGLPQELIKACTNSVLIPMRPGSNSLNAAVAAAILLWEMCRGKQGE